MLYVYFQSANEDDSFCDSCNVLVFGSEKLCLRRTDLTLATSLHRTCYVMKVPVSLLYSGLQYCKNTQNEVARKLLLHVYI